MRGKMKEVAEQAGVSLSYEGEGEAPHQMMWNTRDCHKLLAFALAEAGPQVQTALNTMLVESQANSEEIKRMQEVAADKQDQDEKLKLECQVVITEKFTVKKGLERMDHLYIKAKKDNKE